MDCLCCAAASADVRRPIALHHCAAWAGAWASTRPHGLDEQTFRISDQFALGDDIIVAPVVTKGALDRDVYLTDGLWEDAALPGVRHQGPRWLRAYPAPLDALPIFHRV